MPLLALPNDILLLIAEEVEAERDLSSFTLVKKRLYYLFSDVLHRHNIQYSNSSALFWAIRNDRLDTVDRMLNLGADVEAKENGLTPLFVAVCDGNTAIVKLLLARGAHHRFAKDWPWSPLFAAATAGHTDIVRLLVDRDGPEAVDESFPGDWDKLLTEHLFVTKGPDVQREVGGYTIPLFLAIARLYDEAALVLIESGKVDVNYRDAWGRTALMWACSQGCPDVITSLLDHGADPTIPDPRSGMNVFIAAFGDQNERLVRTLLAHRSIDPNWRHPSKDAPLSAALSIHDRSMFDALIERPDLDVNYRDSNNMTPLHNEVRRYGREADALRFLTPLVNHPAMDIDARTTDGRTALHLAAELGRVRTIDLLLGRGADPTLRDADGRTPHSHAAAAGQTKAFKRLMETRKIHKGGYRRLRAPLPGF
ncbi:ankyrin repeat domain-containing protein [Aspergillus undulatus]|uniref:ankyrin repeat domain-containing protein n=1 Tax=Aspergillus undulatus TaxID=1810928 RepID=UPI003CCDB3D5